MPLPLGHIAIGLTAHEAGSARSAFSRWKLFAAIVVLSNLPDLDVIIGLLFQWNGSAFHRGPTHSLLFALATGFIASRTCRSWRWLPQLGFLSCFSLILSHVAADALLSSSAVSFLWPLETHFTSGQSGWGDVAGMVLKGNAQDARIALGAAAVIITCRVVRALASSHAEGLRRLNAALHVALAFQAGGRHGADLAVNSPRGEGAVVNPADPGHPGAGAGSSPSFCSRA